MGTIESANTTTVRELTIYRLEAGKIAEHWVELAMLEIMEQIWGVPAEQAKA